MSRFMSRVLVVAVLGTLTLTGSAFAKPGYRTLQRTYPYASRLCAKSQANRLPKRLKGDEAQIDAACATLANAFATAVPAVQQAELTFSSGVQIARAKARAICQQGRGTKGHALACRQARRDARQSIVISRQSRRIAVLQFRQSIESARQAFWSTVRSLRGAAGLRADAPQPNAPLPSGAQQ